MSTKKKYEGSDKDLAIKALRGITEGLAGEDGVNTFISELLTESEQFIIGRRILIAQMLIAGHSQIDIRDRLHISPNTMIRTRKWLEKRIPNYKEILETEVSSKGGKRFDYMNALSFRTPKKKAPTHYLLCNIAEELKK